MKKQSVINQIPKAAVLLAILGFGYTGCKNVKTTKPTVKATASGGCIGGRVLNHKGKGVGGVTVETTPKTTTTLTDDAGYFDICHRRVVIDADIGKTKSAPIQAGKYVIKLKKENHKISSKTFNFQGKKVYFKIVLHEKEAKFRDVAVKDQKKSQGENRRMDNNVQRPAPRGS